MLKKIAVVLSTVIFAFFILSVSVLRSSALRPNIRVYSATPLPESDGSLEEKAEVTYYMPFCGKILPDSPIWPVKALRDKLWMAINTNPRKAELSLLFADKRLMSSYELFKINKPQIALTTLTKAEKYLEEAGVLEKDQRERGVDTKSFLLTLAIASLKHTETIDEMLVYVPDDIKPEAIKTQDYSKKVYGQCKEALESFGIVAPQNPLDTE